MAYFPNHHVILDKAIITRWRMLPSGITGQTHVKEGDTVGINDVVASGLLPSDYVIVDFAAAVGLDPDDEQLYEIMTLERGQALSEGAPLGDSKKRAIARKIPKAPAKSIVALIEHGRVILQLRPEMHQVKARIPGEVMEVEPNVGVAIETHGALLQCAWGNGRFNSTPFAFEPGTELGNAQIQTAMTGLADLLKEDILLSPYRGRTIILMRPLTETDLAVIEQQELGGIIAPCAAPHLREKAIQLKVPVILTEGFGHLPITSRLYEILAERASAQAIFDATEPNVLNNDRPEIIIPGGSARADAHSPDTSTALQSGMRVRIRRAPYAGRVGVVKYLPERPLVVDNGLRMLCAQVKLQSGELVMVPRANIETLGELS